MVCEKLTNAVRQKRQLLATTVIPCLSHTSICDKIKLIAERKSYLGVHNLATADDVNTKPLVSDRLEENTSHYMWRWEVSLLTLLPDHYVTEVKRARAARKKLSLHYKAIFRLLQLIDKTKSAKDDNSKKQVKVAEERVLKYEREEEAKRLQEHEKDQIRAALLKDKMAKQEGLKRKREDERRAREEERALKKSKKEEEKRKAKEETERQERAVAQSREVKLQKQRKIMANFFKPPTSTTKAYVARSTSINKEAFPGHNYKKEGHDTDLFWHQLQAQHEPPIMELRKEFCNSSRNRRHKFSTRTVYVSVTVTAAPPPGTYTSFADEGYYRERTIIAVPNKLKFLKFHEDFRPAYRGTWRKKKSDIVTGRRPLGKDTQHLNYDVDSEAEWEEEEDGDEGEDIQKDDDDMEEEEEPGMDSRNYNYSDGWLANDNEIEAEDDDDAGITKKIVIQTQQDGGVTPWCVIGSGPHWIPSTCPSLSSEIYSFDMDAVLIGVTVKDATDMIAAHHMQLYKTNVEIDFSARKPEIMKEKKSPSPTANETLISAADRFRIKTSDLEVFCRFVHGSTLTSREKIVEEFRLGNPIIKCSRSELHRKLDILAVKHKLSTGGVVWEVKNEALSSLGLFINLKVIQSFFFMHFMSSSHPKFCQYFRK